MKVTLCGSARFEREFHEWNKKLSMSGHTVYSLVAFPSVEGDKSWYDEQTKTVLDLLHLSKIEESDAIVVLNKDGYIGDSTRREIQWAIIRGKGVWVIDDNSLREFPVEGSADLICSEGLNT